MVIIVKDIAVSKANVINNAVRRIEYSLFTFKADKPANLENLEPKYISTCPNDTSISLFLFAQTFQGVPRNAILRAVLEIS